MGRRNFLRQVLRVLGVGGLDTWLGACLRRRDAALIFQLVRDAHQHSLRASSYFNYLTGGSTGMVKKRFQPSEYTEKVWCDGNPVACLLGNSPHFADVGKKRIFIM